MQQFLDDVALAQPTPGGGACAALAGALAAALTQMVAGLTVGRRKYKDAHEEMQAILDQIPTIRTDLTQAIADDAVVYQRVLLMLQQRTNNNEKTLTQALEDALVGAAQVPLRVARLGHDIADMAGKVITHGNRHALTDALVALLLAQTAVRASRLGVISNLKEIQDDKLRKRWVNEATRHEKAVNELVETLLPEAEARLTAAHGDEKPGRRRRRS
ncbi:MAG: cyclodeaminase/cyclohydrolase family protein [Anaerolineales bacterium]|nr:cyclodeaminase/cyclohydrolase family protein [Anaerolineales bacterium]